MPRRAAFCKSSILVVTSIASRCLETLGVTAPSAPTTIGTTFALTFQSRATSLRRSWYFSTFSFSFSTIPASPGTAISIMLLVFLSPVHYNHVWSSRLDVSGCLDVKVSEEFNMIVFNYPFGSMPVLCSLSVGIIFR